MKEILEEAKRAIHDYCKVKEIDHRKIRLVIGLDADEEHDGLFFDVNDGINNAESAIFQVEAVLNGEFAQASIVLIHVETGKNIFGIFKPEDKWEIDYYYGMDKIIEEPEGKK